MLPHQIVERQKIFPAAFVGMGMLEWHGQHLAVGNDGLKAEKLCELAAARSGGFAFPAMWHAVPHVIHNSNGSNDRGGKARRIMGWRSRKFKEGYIGASCEEQIALWKSVLRHTLIQLNLFEMRAVVLVCGHYPLIDYASPVVEQFNKDYPDTRAFAGIEFQFTPENSIHGKEAGGDHAAVWETSYLMCLRPECVDMTVYQDRRTGRPEGLWGDDPRGRASVARGERATKLIVAGMVDKARQLVRQAGAGWQAKK